MQYSFDVLLSFERSNLTCCKHADIDLDQSSLAGHKGVTRHQCVLKDGSFYGRIDRDDRFWYFATFDRLLTNVRFCGNKRTIAHCDLPSCRAESTHLRGTTERASVSRSPSPIGEVEHSCASTQVSFWSKSGHAWTARPSRILT